MLYHAPPPSASFSRLHSTTYFLLTCTLLLLSMTRFTSSTEGLPAPSSAATAKTKRTAARAAPVDVVGSLNSRKNKQAGNEDGSVGGGGAAGGGVYGDDGDDGMYEPVTPGPIPTSVASSHEEEQPQDSLAVSTSAVSSYEEVQTQDSPAGAPAAGATTTTNFCCVCACTPSGGGTMETRGYIKTPVVHNQPTQHTNVRIKHPQSPYSEEIYTEIEEEIYASASDEIQALAAQVSSAGVQSSMLERFKRSRLLESLGTKVKQISDGIQAKLASAGKPATQVEVAKKLNAIVPKEVSANLSVALEDAHRSNAELQQKIAVLQATRALPSVPGKRDITAGQAGLGGGGGDADDDNWINANVEDVDCEVPFFLPVNTEESTGLGDDDGDDYEILDKSPVQGNSL